MQLCLVAHCPWVVCVCACVPFRTTKLQTSRGRKRQSNDQDDRQLIWLSLGNNTTTLVQSQVGFTLTRCGVSLWAHPDQRHDRGKKWALTEVQHYTPYLALGRVVEGRYLPAVLLNQLKMMTAVSNHQVRTPGFWSAWAMKTDWTSAT